MMRGSGVEPFLEPNEQWAKSAEVKNVMNTLELECSRSTFPVPPRSVVVTRPLSGQQVADLLRDRLQSTGGELVDAKSRIAELETAQVHDRAGLGQANDTIRSISTCSTLD